jgi:hypothetical protein
VKPPMHSARGNEVASKGTLYYPVEESGWQGQNLSTAIPSESYEKIATASSPCEGMCELKRSRFPVVAVITTVIKYVRTVMHQIGHFSRHNSTRLRRRYVQYRSICTIQIINLYG